MSRNHASVAAGFILSAILSGCGGGGDSYAAADPEQQRSIDALKENMLKNQAHARRGFSSSPLDKMRASMLRKAR